DAVAGGELLVALEEGLPRRDILLRHAGHQHLQVPDALTRHRALEILQQHGDRRARLGWLGGGGSHPGGHADLLGVEGRQPGHPARSRAASAESRCATSAALRCAGTGYVSSWSSVAPVSAASGNGAATGEGERDT